MGTTFHGPSPWPHITAALRGPGPRYAAIAYLGTGAPDLLPLAAGDVLVVNAGRAAIRAHATAPSALAHFVDVGVRVLSSPNLHANAVATPKIGIVGSASATNSSTVADEAVVISDDSDVVESVRAFICGIDAITEVDQVFLDNATAIWAIGRAIPLPGVTGRGRAEPDFLPAVVERMFLWHIADYQPTGSEKEQWAWRAGAHSAAAGPRTTYGLEWFRVDSPAVRRFGRLQRGDVLVQVSADNWIHPPAVVDSDAIPIPHTRSAVAYLLRTGVDLEPIAIADAAKALADLGHPNPRLRRDHRVISSSLRSAILRLWDL
ncbi:phosphatidylserine/phosphatidylglycerophosphate/cardiolipin synthase family protein [Rhodococcus sp. NPDC003318]|uniref:phosphatidylserine/phosphatidylglycerophosphate/ cardiolipin synthase family protein n=1 Tax=Rhodococcus sp. NPDC003318 TaxID=3364503 RepID=UPI0036C71091